MEQQSRKKLIKIASVLVVGAIAIVAGYAVFVHAQFFIDSFTTEDNVDGTWRVTVATTTGEVKLEAKSCDDAVWFCGAGFDDVCANGLADGNYIIVKRADVSSTKQWKVANTACDRPECGQNSGQDGDNLVADNTVGFGNYPAQDACKAVGGRLPTKAELSCMYTNRVTFGNNFVASYYWSSTEYSATGAWNQFFSAGGQYNGGKTDSNYVRCVRGW